MAKIYEYREHEKHLASMVSIVSSGFENGLCGPQGSAKKAFSDWADRLRDQIASTIKEKRAATANNDW